jgi:hypothetical protein
MAIKIVFPCCSGKEQQYWKHESKKVKFVAEPGQCSESAEFLYCRPDDPIPPGNDRTWRDELEKYNLAYKHTGGNPYNLCKAWGLYLPRVQMYQGIYRGLKERFEENFFILSAGWGLVESDFLLPYYDITLSSSQKIKECYKRKKGKIYHDFNDLKTKVKQDDTIYFPGLKDYLDLYYYLMKDLPGKKVIYHYCYCQKIGKKEGYDYRRFCEGGQRTWHYEWAKRLILGELILEPAM